MGKFQVIPAAARASLVDYLRGRFVGSRGFLRGFSVGYPFRPGAVLDSFGVLFTFPVLAYGTVNWIGRREVEVCMMDVGFYRAGCSYDTISTGFNLVHLFLMYFWFMIFKIFGKGQTVAGLVGHAIGAVILGQVMVLIGFGLWNVPFEVAVVLFSWVVNENPNVFIEWFVFVSLMFPGRGFHYVVLLNYYPLLVRFSDSEYGSMVRGIFDSGVVQFRGFSDETGGLVRRELENRGDAGAVVASGTLEDGCSRFRALYHSRLESDRRSVSDSYFMSLPKSFSDEERRLALLGDRLLKLFAAERVYKNKEPVSAVTLYEDRQTDEVFSKWCVKFVEPRDGFGKKVVSSFPEVLWGEMYLEYIAGRLSYNQMWAAFVRFEHEVVHGA